MACAEEPPTKKRKQPSFSEDELVMLVVEVAKRKSVLCGSFSSDISRRTRDAAWAEVTAAVNSVSRAVRCEKDVRKKYRDFRSDVKRKIGLHKKKMRSTGGGPYEKLELKASEEALVNAGLLELEAVEGLAGVVDSEQSFPVAGPSHALAVGDEDVRGPLLNPCTSSSAPPSLHPELIDEREESMVCHDVLDEESCPVIHITASAPQDHVCGRPEENDTPPNPSSSSTSRNAGRAANRPLAEIATMMIDVQAQLNANVRDIAQHMSVMVELNENVKSIAQSLQIIAEAVQKSGRQ